MSHPTEAPTVEQLRADIDSGRTGDKVAANDPATVPLGADEEAAGTPPSREAIAQARRAETSRGTAVAKGGSGPGYAWVLIVFIPLCGAAIVILSFLVR